MKIVIGTILRNRYKILQFLGGGAFGETYLAEDLDLPNQPKFVVKHLKPKTSESDVLQVAQRLFESEAKVLYKLGNLSQQIPKLFAHFQENGEFYLVQEFIDGYDLSAEIIPGKKLSESELIQLLQEILEVLAVVHQQNIIHRDIKPQNLMRRQEDSKIILIDFGAVKEIKGLLADTEGQVISTVIIGSNGYMPNEQANSKPKLASDIYAVGIIAIQALTGKLPQEFSEDPQSGEIIWQNEAKVSKKLASVLTKMVNCQFNLRYQSATEALEAVKSLSSFTIKLQKLVIPVCLSVVVLSGLIFAFMNFLKRPATVVKQPAKSESNLQLVCPETSFLSQPLASKPDLKIGNSEYYGLSREKGTGKGSVVFPDKKTGTQARYDGEMKNYKRNGCGIYTVNGDSYRGQFQDDKFHGQGINTFKSGDRYIGQFENGFFQGKGEFICKNGNKYIGEFRNNKLHGKVTFISQNGSNEKIEIWEDGKLKEGGKIFDCNAGK
ncbi:Serine/threonine-protein kinase D [Dolichospermum sp. UHCC 0315A]|uniref:protein kinase domain-containing protein n=1 Tax=Dolichospermum sp. UHCC 0315A TaxID=1914871 RepID=UPI0011E89B24|nr:protein kinase [Dolichospermum sp. UHCC 0315A]QEI39686.1 Serine/threonine-protein kinase D [Dolichospermum sp. UHCC 0315A]